MYEYIYIYVCMYTYMHLKEDSEKNRVKHWIRQEPWKRARGQSPVAGSSFLTQGSPKTGYRIQTQATDLGLTV